MKITHITESTDLRSVVYGDTMGKQYTVKLTNKTTGAYIYSHTDQPDARKGQLLTNVIQRNFPRFEIFKNLDGLTGDDLLGKLDYETIDRDNESEEDLLGATLDKALTPAELRGVVGNYLRSNNIEYRSKTKEIQDLMQNGQFKTGQDAIDGALNILGHKNESTLEQKVQKMRELVERAKHVRANSKKPKIVKPNTGHESPHPYDNAGFVGENTKDEQLPHCDSCKGKGCDDCDNTGEDDGYAYGTKGDTTKRTDEISMQDIKKGAKVAAVTGAIALGGAGIGKVSDYMNQSTFDYSIQLPQLEMYLDYAEAQKDQRMIKQLKTRIRNHEGRLSIGKGDVDGRDGTPMSFEVVYDKENPNFDPLGDPMQLNKKFKDARDNMPEGKSPHKKGTPKYKKHMAAMHAEGKESNDKGVDLVLPRGKLQVLKAEDKDYDRGVLIELLEDGGYDMAYWYDKFKTYPVEVLVDGKSIKKDAKKVTMKYHPELEEAKNKKPELPKQNNPVAKHSRNKSGAGAHIDKKKEAKKRGDFSPIDEAQYSADKAALLSAVLNELEKEVMDADNTRMLRRLARIIGKKVFRRENGQLTLEDKE